MTVHMSIITKLQRAAIALLAAATMLVSVVPVATAQEISPEHLALARKYLDLTDHSGVYEGSVVQAGIDVYQRLLPQNPSVEPQLNKAIETVIASYKGRKGELFDQIARVYAVVFTPEELQVIVDFYSSPAGLKLSKANAELNSTIQRVMNIFSVNLNRDFLAAVRAELKAQGIDS
jgi:uncharacterized protein